VDEVEEDVALTVPVEGAKHVCMYLCTRSCFLRASRTERKEPQKEREGKREGWLLRQVRN
jgi:hypothetical protein